MRVPMTTARRGCGVVALDDKLYIIGGSDGQQSLATVEILDLNEGVWSVGPIMTTPRANVSVVIVNNRIFAIGGFNGKMFVNTMEVLEPNTNEWRIWVPRNCLPIMEAEEILENGSDASDVEARL